MLPNAHARQGHHSRLGLDQIERAFPSGAFIESNRLMGRGVGYIDAHLLAATTQVAQRSRTQLWTVNRRANDIATSLGLAYSPTQ